MFRSFSWVSLGGFVRSPQINKQHFVLTSQSMQVRSTKDLWPQRVWDNFWRRLKKICFFLWSWTFKTWAQSKVEENLSTIYNSLGSLLMWHELKIAAQHASGRCFTSASDVWTGVYLWFVCAGTEVRCGSLLLPVCRACLWYGVRGTTHPSGIPVTTAAGPSFLTLVKVDVGLAEAPSVWVTLRMSLPIAVSISLGPA